MPTKKKRKRMPKITIPVFPTGTNGPLPPGTRVRTKNLHFGVVLVHRHGEEDMTTSLVGLDTGDVISVPPGTLTRI